MTDRACQCFFCQGFPSDFTTEEVHATAEEMIAKGHHTKAKEQAQEEPAE
jgi:hypothetical protein